nr:MAG TPA: hypothetical protein [Caudoviricetes sp.]
MRLAPPFLLICAVFLHKPEFSTQNSTVSNDCRSNEYC